RRQEPVLAGQRGRRRGDGSLRAVRAGPVAAARAPLIRRFAPPSPRTRGEGNSTGHPFSPLAGRRCPAGADEGRFQPPSASIIGARYSAYGAHFGFSRTPIPCRTWIALAVATPRVRDCRSSIAGSNSSPQ